MMGHPMSVHVYNTLQIIENANCIICEVLTGHSMFLNGTVQDDRTLSLCQLRGARATSISLSLGLSG